MLLAAHQPNFLPNLGFFYKMIQVEKFVVFTNVQFSKNDNWVRRHKIPTPIGDQWLTVPVSGSSMSQIIRDVQINPHNVAWRRKHSNTLKVLYHKTKEQDVLKAVLSVYEQEWTRLADLNFAFIKLFHEILDIKTPLLFDEETTGSKFMLLINLCKEYGADECLSGAGGKEYMTDVYYETLKEHSITNHFVERNLTAEYPYTTLHYLLTLGVEGTRKILDGKATEDDILRDQGLLVSAS